ncbi:Histidinol dehydrogenase [Leptospira biflexa serovar Patoc strain 'Patoc 1 (Ames)']|uniref:Histidinol dehydrogenase n=2 Tax=Leptospira biflexa serovar Patoc TaxID=145259 RepID=HISX_LEPBP|nr:histidinol dehydrogenase [Leptospira biflexa]B0S9F2.1 RecName: Full=Histidinol dehydrogenase; Short=HDH [Leptospira biflexa serovar Patoc strain 'Patoc 1 (Ames)']B0SS41.1 RecName: Full=Histidinol dehydrogenase; Short=HDH [Leptospira biflexa serovar Patoc strain 'Patoc 1 (Paris)']ABZ94279.1 Histidinol dehydrogenase [Leptospira biflexa serovar Patoc strain 'Patoc 1 (Ames)']ABZ97931.1 Histidinol dehydrogenase [Leptospira biflexa serovar Patoc strain 'Patoc 1 (Paris)']
MPIPILHCDRNSKELYSRFLQGAREDLTTATDRILPILESVRTQGDQALFSYTEMFDGIKLSQLTIDPKKIKTNVDEKTKEAFLRAKSNIEAFHMEQKRESWSKVIDGNRLGVKYTPIPSLAVYAPGGKALYPSSVLMGIIPAKIAGVPSIQLITPPQKDGIPEILVWLAQIMDIDRIVTVGGAQGIAAAAYGTESVPKSEFIVGPGNAYVAAAKSYLSGQGLIGIESPAGPSEVCIIADENANPKWIACDMLSQAEHGEDSSAILLTTDLTLAKRVSEELEIAFSERPKRLQMKQTAIYENSSILVFPTLDDCIWFSNELAPEHLEIQTKDYESVFAKIEHAGSVFLGPYSPVAMGDYISGTNHILPTARGSRIYSSLGVDTFLKRVTFQEVTKESLENLYPFVKLMSELEGLDEEHGTSVKVRTRQFQ